MGERASKEARREAEKKRSLKRAGKGHIIASVLTRGWDPRSIDESTLTCEDYVLPPWAQLRTALLGPSPGL